jgi:hypothetical protein
LHVVRPSLEDRIEYHKAMRVGKIDWPFTIQAYAAMTLDVRAQQIIDELISPTGALSVKAAVEADRTLGGLADDLIVQSVGGPLEFARENGASVWGCEFSVLVVTQTT